MDLPERLRKLAQIHGSEKTRHFSQYETQDIVLDAARVIAAMQGVLAAASREAK